ncbi:MAG: hypothetical protein SGJ04_06115 [Bacteroidota bacterium]|nr:hypothetical protein [Bacteroidota bacterium]
MESALKTVTSRLLAVTLVCLFAASSGATAKMDTLRMGLKGIGLLGNDKWYNKAVDSSIVIISQDYVAIASNGEMYGRNGAEYYGRSYGIGFCINGKVYVAAQLSKPWEDDPAAKDLKDSFKPTLSTARTKTLWEGSYGNNLEVEYGNEKYISAAKITHSSKCYDHASNHLVERGKLYLIYASGNRLSDTTHFSSLAQTVSVTWSSTNTYATLNVPLTLKSPILGGIYFEEVVVNGGVQFVPVGMLYVEWNQWKIAPFPSQLVPLQPSIIKKKKSTHSNGSRLTVKNSN